MQEQLFTAVNRDIESSVAIYADIATMATRIKSLYDDLSGFVGGSFKCNKCKHCLQGKPKVDMLLNYHGQNSGWVRHWVHVECIQRYFQYNQKEPSQALHRAAHVLLVLELLGLPRDIAWPIVAGAYWLL